MTWIKRILGGRKSGSGQQADDMYLEDALGADSELIDFHLIQMCKRVRTPEEDFDSIRAALETGLSRSPRPIAVAGTPEVTTTSDGHVATIRLAVKAHQVAAIKQEVAAAFKEAGLTD